MTKFRKNGYAKRRKVVALAMVLRTGNHAGPHANRTKAVAKGHSRKVKHKSAGQAG